MSCNMTHLRWLLLFSPQCLTLKVAAWQIFFLWPMFRILPNHPEKHPIATPCFSTAVAAAAPSASHPRRPRPDAAAFGGSGRPRRRGRAADLCRGHAGRGRQRRPWPRKGFRVVLGVALTRWWKGFVHWQLIFLLCFESVEWYSYLLFKDPLLWVDGPLEIRVKEMTKHGGTWVEGTWRDKCSLDLELLITLSWIPHLSFKKLKRLIAAVWHELWAETSCHKRRQVDGM